MAELLFYVLGALALAAALGVVLSKSPMMSVLSLLASFFCLAVIYLLAGMQFIAAAQILVYAGAILVLFLFVIMLLDLAHVPAGATAPLLGSRTARIAAALALALGTMGLIAAQKSSLAAPDLAAQEAGIDDITLLATALFGRYSLAFEAAGMLLLATMVCVIVLAKRQRPGSVSEAVDEATEGGRS